MKTKMIAMDTSTRRSALAFFVNGKLKDHVIFDYSNIKDIEERTTVMGRSILSYLDDKKPDIVFIEQPKGKPNMELVRKLSRILGIVMGWAISNKKYYEEVMPSVWRKYLPEFNQGGKNRDELKEESMRIVKKKYGLVLDDDQCDAINLGDAMLNRYYDEQEELFS